MMTEEDRNKLAQEIWAKSAKEIEQSIRSAIHCELRSDIQSRSRRLVDAEMGKILGPMLNTRLEELVQAAEKIVDRVFVSIEAKVLDALQYKLQDHVEGVFDAFAYELAASMKTSALQTVEKALHDAREARDRAYQERKNAALEGSKGSD